MIWLKQSTASQEVLLGPFLDDIDGKTAETGLTIANTDIKVWKSGATTEASKNSGGATHIAAGRYYAVLDATDTDTVGPMEINVHVAGALPVRRAATVLHANVFDWLFGSTAPSTYAGGAVASVTGAVGSVTAGVTVTTNSDKTGYSLATTPPTSADIADAVWDELAAGHVGAGSFGARLDISVSTRLATASYTSPPDSADIADKILGRAIAGGADGGRTVTQALQALRNKVTRSGGTLTVYAADDSTSSWTATYTTDDTAEPIVAVDPV
jgi:hypothetical protein